MKVELIYLVVSKWSVYQLKNYLFGDGEKVKLLRFIITYLALRKRHLTNFVEFVFGSKITIL